MDWVDFFSCEFTADASDADSRDCRNLGGDTHRCMENADYKIFDYNSYCCHNSFFASSRVQT